MSPVHLMFSSEKRAQSRPYCVSYDSWVYWSLSLSSSADQVARTSKLEIQAGRQDPVSRQVAAVTETHRVLNVSSGHSAVRCVHSTGTHHILAAVQRWVQCAGRIRACGLRSAGVSRSADGWRTVTANGKVAVTVSVFLCTAWTLSA